MRPSGQSVKICLDGETGQDHVRSQQPSVFSASPGLWGYAVALTCQRAAANWRYRAVNIHVVGSPDDPVLNGLEAGTFPCMVRGPFLPHRPP